MPLIDKDEVKRAATRQWQDILVSVGGLPSDYFTTKERDCPRCGGSTRFRVMDADQGAVRCNNCFREKCGDGFAAIGWLLGVSFPEAVRLVADHLGIASESTDSPTAPKPIDLLQLLANVKGCTREGLAEYGGEVHGDCVVFPCYGPDKLQCSTFTIWPKAPKGSKGLKGILAKGKPSGIFLPFMDQGVHFPQPGETWIVCEGCKDAAAWYSLGYHAAGVNGEDLVRQKFVPLFRDVHVILAPDRTEQAERLAHDSAARLYGVSASVRICQLPLKIATKEGSQDAR